jgi:hypothetical protein
MAAFRAAIRRGIEVNLVVGVAIPFAAHCWVQHADMVLNDSVDIVSRYEPILVI